MEIKTTNKMLSGAVFDWSKTEVCAWAKNERLGVVVVECICQEDIDGKSLLTLSENDIRDLRDKYGYHLRISDIKRFWIAAKTLQKDNQAQIVCMGLTDCSPPPPQSATILGHHLTSFHSTDLVHLNEMDRVSPPLSIDGRATSIQPEVFKTMISLGYAFLVTWITAFVMVVVHERVPDMKRYPPLPDIFLDNVPHIPWAFHMCEITGTILFSLWLCVCIVHKHRLVLLRRFFALAGTVFLLRCVTMLITSLSVPGTHLQCNPNDYKVDDTNLTVSDAIELRVSRAYTIWSGLGMSIRGVRTCGDYMFSGHTVALTLLNFFITEYTPRNLYFLHTMTWLLNMFGIFFILAAHEHYSIDVFVAFYITSRLFLYYHTLANNQALMSHDSNRTRIWFPMFSYFESSVDGIIPNEYDTITTILSKIFAFVTAIKDSFMLTARRFWVAPNQLAPFTKTILRPVTTSQTITGSSASIKTTSSLQSSPTKQETLAKNLNNIQANFTSNNLKSLPEKDSLVLLNNDFKEENFKNVELEMKSAVDGDGAAVMTKKEN